MNSWKLLPYGAALALASAAMACSPQQAHETIPAEPVQSVHPVSGLKIVPLTVTSGKQRHAFDVEVAQTLQDQAKGLMFRTELAPDKGMIFPRNPPGMASFWMKNTPLPLDIIFVGVDNRIINIAAETVPYSLDPVASADIAGAVLEIPGGRAAELGIKPGDLVEWGK